MRFAIMSDTHYISRRMIADKTDKELMLQPAVTEAAVLQASKACDVLFITGDLTDSGDRFSHEDFSALLRKVRQSGTKVFVIFATHDFHHHKAYVRKYGEKTEYKCRPWDSPYFDTDKAEWRKWVNDESASLSDEELIPQLVPALSPEEIWEIYREFGPDEAIAVHRQSMSYVVQLCDGYRLFALNDDSNLNGKSGFSDECFKWITEQAEAARNDGQFILAMTHHPLIAPSPIYEIIGKGDMLGDYDKRLYQLADIGIQFIFTGHTHIHNISADISKKGNVIYDICSGTTIGYPGVIRQIKIEPENGTVTASTDFVNEPESYKNSGNSLREVFENQLIGTIRGMITAAGTSIDDLAKMATAISIKPKVIYKFGWIIKPVFKLLNSLKVGTVAKWTKKETGLRPQDYADIKDKKVVDIITELVLNLYGGESKYPPETPTYKITMGLLSIVDSILKTLHIDLGKIIKVVPDASSLVEPLLYNGKIDSYEAVLNIYPFVAEGESGNKLVFDEKPSTVKKSKKGPWIIVIGTVLLLATLPLWLIIILVAFLINQIKYGKKIK